MRWGGGSKQPVLRLHAPNFPHSDFSVAGSDVWRFFRDFITKEQNSSTANSEGGGWGGGGGSIHWSGAAK